MEERKYEPSLLFCGVLTSRGFPSSLKEELEERWGRIVYTSPDFDFNYTDYYIDEMGEGIKRFFLAFERLVMPDCLAQAKLFSNEIEKRYSEDGKRKINLDPGLMGISNIILATTKNRAHRIAIGHNLYAEVTLIYHRSGYESFSWTYSDYKDKKIQNELMKIREIYKKLRKEGAQEEK